VPEVFLSCHGESTSSIREETTVDIDKRDGSEETGVCACGAVAEYFGPDPFASEMCWTYWDTPKACEPGCSCWDERWMCEYCHDQSVDDI
jgi:hypothetical protein